MNIEKALQEYIVKFHNIGSVQNHKFTKVSIDENGQTQYIYECKYKTYRREDLGSHIRLMKDSWS